MNGAFSIALSGMHTASLRLAVSADNVANAFTGRPVEIEGEIPAGVFQPRRVEAISLAGGGVRGVVTPIVPATQLVPDATSPTGLAAVPNVDLTRETVEQILAAASYRANAAVLRTQAEIEDTLLDIRV